MGEAPYFLFFNAGFFGGPAICWNSFTQGKRLLVAHKAIYGNTLA
jgi:hypothetical protein